MTYKIGDIFTNDKEYTARAQWCNEHGYYIAEIEQKNGTRQFKICAPKEKTLDEQTLEELQKEQTELNAQIEQLKDQLLTATLADDTDQIESIKAQYQTLVGGE